MKSFYKISGIVSVGWEWGVKLGTEIGCGLYFCGAIRRISFIYEALRKQKTIWVLES